MFYDVIHMIFIDTGAFLAMFYSKDRNHPSAQAVKKKIMAGQYGKMITINYILDELITLLQKFIDHEAIVQAVEPMRSSSNLKILWISQNVEKKSWKYFKTHQDKSFSFTDCTSFTTMEMFGIDKAFTYDSHFSQAGYQQVR